MSRLKREAFIAAASRQQQHGDSTTGLTGDDARNFLMRQAGGG